MVLSREWTTKKVDCTNDFAQVEIKEEVYVEQPKGFKNFKDKVNKVIFLLKTLYGLKQVPRVFFDKLKEGLIERGSKQSNHDPCLLRKRT